jgi:hypothetical protein
MRSNINLTDAFQHLSCAQRDLEEAVLRTFVVFELCHATIAQALEMWIGDRRKAAHWMSFRRGAFEGKSGYEMVIDGDIDKLWEHIEAANSPHNDGISGAVVDRIERQM